MDFFIMTVNGFTKINLQPRTRNLGSTLSPAGDLFEKIALIFTISSPATGSKVMGRRS